MTIDQPLRVSRRAILAAGAIGGVTLAGAPLTARANPPGRPDDPRALPEPLRVPEAIGAGGAVSSVDPYASDVGIQILRRGGNAADAAIAMAATLGVTEPFSCGIGGGGFFVYYDARQGKVATIDGRETAPMSFTETVFTDGAGGALNFAEVVSSGLSVGVPGTPATWELAARRFGTRPLAVLLQPAEQIARQGFVVDRNYANNVAGNAERFAKFPETVRVFMPGGQPPTVGSIVRNPDLARTYQRLRTKGMSELYHGSIAEAIVAEARNPSTAAGIAVFSGQLTLADLQRYAARVLAPTRSNYYDHEVFGMGVPSSGGIAVGAILNLLQAYAHRTGIPLSDVDPVQYYHRFSEASATAFADRNRWVGDVPDVPVGELLSKGFAGERALLFDPQRAQSRPIPFGYPDGDYEDPTKIGERQGEVREGVSTTHLNAVDRWGNVASYTLTIEQTGGSGITVPGHGFLLNNELTDFNFVPTTPGVPDPNLPGPGKRPRSSMSPTLVFEDGRPLLSVGTPGGATIITTVAQIIIGYLDRGLSLVDAIAAPRLSSRNGTESTDGGLAESEIGAGLRALGHTLSVSTSIGLASGIEIRGEQLTAAAETARGGGGAARVVSSADHGKPGRGHGRDNGKNKGKDKGKDHRGRP
ncbi:gamma-glutamyltransferase [Granulicoccus sp. GXG6511]|uniref:gamma-glutamyltransferase n=1 Tax=Granulicoccus sp. GXG6511 TaxID=3381351 RepID=UPI003D7D2B42